MGSKSIPCILANLFSVSMFVIYLMSSPTSGMWMSKIVPFMLNSTKKIFLTKPIYKVKILKLIGHFSSGILWPSAVAMVLGQLARMSQQLPLSCIWIEVTTELYLTRVSFIDDLVSEIYTYSTR